LREFLVDDEKSLFVRPVDVLSAAGVRFLVHAHPEIRTATDIEALDTFVVERSVKVLAFTVDGNRLVLAAIPGPARLQYGRLAAALGTRRALLKPADPARLAALGMQPGGVSPLCADPAVTIVFDTSIPGMGPVFCGSGSADRTLEVEAAEIVRLAPNAVIAEIAAG
jgi:Cys-tRNA(Pro)/Cys-tRNA(Cys) deacylase